MRQDDLMVGDMVMYHPERIDGDNTREPYPVRIQAVDIEDNELFEPIPLTKEILEKNGYVFIERRPWTTHFEHKTLPTIYTDFDIESFNFGGDEVDCECEYKYVHQMQHVLRLIGLFDEANDFVIK